PPTTSLYTLSLHDALPICDPLTATAKILSNYIEPLLTEEFSHIRNIRIGSKSLSYWPYRFLTDKDADNLLDLFTKVKEAGKTLRSEEHTSELQSRENLVCR